MVNPGERGNGRCPGAVAGGLDGDQRASLDIWTKTRNQETWEVLAPTPGRPCSRSSLSMPVGQLAVMENRPHQEVLEEILQGEKR